MLYIQRRLSQQGGDGFLGVDRHPGGIGEIIGHIIVGFAFFADWRNGLHIPDIETISIWLYFTRWIRIIRVGGGLSILVAGMGKADRMGQLVDQVSIAGCALCAGFASPGQPQPQPS